MLFKIGSENGFVDFASPPSPLHKMERGVRKLNKNELFTNEQKQTE